MKDYLKGDTTEGMIHKIIGRNKIKYSVLTELIDGDIGNLKSFIINGDSILIDIHRYIKSNSEIDKDDLTICISSALINIIAHYRNYFAKNGWDVNIYFLADKSDNSSNLSTAMELMRVILKYIPKTYFIDTTNLKTGVIMKYFFTKKDSGHTLILSRDDFDIMNISENVSCIKANKENSKYYSIHNWRKVMSGSEDDYKLVSYKMLNLILCFSGAHGRPGIRGLGFRTMLKKINKAIKDQKVIDNYYSSVHDFINDIEYLFPAKKGVPFNFDKGILNFEIYDVNTNYDKDVTIAVKKRLDSYIEDKFSKKDLIMLNTKYYTGENYLMLEELMIQPKKSEKKW